MRIEAFQIRRGNSLNWTQKNPILLAGEPGFELDTNLLKIGNGVSRWSELPYVNQVGGSTSAELLDHINNEEPHPIYDDGPSLDLLYQNAKA
jgi:hypothetical protein